ncbi:MAG: flagellar motor protein MotB [Pisciglobus halotolerans]|nr:flagellar motor protein MotB [Pisciglobus halotolerans]
MSRKRKKDPAPESSGGWITTFSDLMSLLLTFFILLFSMSVISDDKFTQASQSINTALNASSGILPGELSTIEEAVPAEPVDEEAVPQELMEMYDTVIGYLEDKGLNAEVDVRVDSEGLYMTIQESILFASGKAVVSVLGKETLNDLSVIIQKFDNKVIIEGYTDNVPNAKSGYETNWELSTARSVSVLRYLSEEQQIEPARLSAKGYGEYSPIAPNDTKKNQARNRRVNIVMLYENTKEEGQE